MTTERRPRLIEDEEFASLVAKRALERLREVRLAGETVLDEGDFLVREAEQAHLERARQAGRGRSRGFRREGPHAG